MFDQQGVPFLDGLHHQQGRRLAQSAGSIRRRKTGGYSCACDRCAGSHGCGTAVRFPAPALKCAGKGKKGVPLLSHRSPTQWYPTDMNTGHADCDRQSRQRRGNGWKSRQEVLLLLAWHGRAGVSWSDLAAESRSAAAVHVSAWIGFARRWEKLAQRTKPRLLQEATASLRCGSALGVALEAPRRSGLRFPVTARQPIAEAVGAPMHALVLRSARILTRRHSLLSVRSYGTPASSSSAAGLHSAKLVPHPVPPPTLGYKSRRARHLHHLCRLSSSCTLAPSCLNHSIPHPSWQLPNTDTGVKPDDFTEFDYVVVGGGTAGLAVAARLSETPLCRSACSKRGCGVPNAPRSTTRRSSHSNGRKYPWPRGKVLGGSSALNFLVWQRGYKGEYDDIGKLGNSGWSWDDFANFARKSATLEKPSKGLQDAHLATYARRGSRLLRSGPDLVQQVVHRSTASVVRGAQESRPRQRQGRSGRQQRRLLGLAGYPVPQERRALVLGQRLLCSNAKRSNLKVITGAPCLQDPLCRCQERCRRARRLGCRVFGRRRYLHGQGSQGGGGERRYDQQPAPARALGHRQGGRAQGSGHRTAHRARRGRKRAGPSLHHHHLQAQAGPHHLGQDAPGRLCQGGHGASTRPAATIGASLRRSSRASPTSL
ncbi:hypothetical protein L1887_61350 [Cichorium endivia]|nr:hypothetical protein L1887_61350 [Cichorium endivia]